MQLSKLLIFTSVESEQSDRGLERHLLALCVEPMGGQWHWYQDTFWRIGAHPQTGYFELL